MNEQGTIIKPLKLKLLYFFVTAILDFGPNASVCYGRLFATLTGLWQITSVQDEADFQHRFLIATN